MESGNLLLEQLKTYGVRRRGLDDELFVDDKPIALVGVYASDDENHRHEIMEPGHLLLEKLKTYGVGRRRLDDELFAGDKAPALVGVYFYDDLNLCQDLIKVPCNVPGCTFAAASLLEYENHYNAAHRYSCGQCKKVLPSPHLLDLHIQETHDSFFAVMAERKPSYCCYIEECKEKFANPDERLEHGVKQHRLLKDFRFAQKPKNKKGKPNKNPNQSMDLDETGTSEAKNKIVLTNNKQKTFAKYTGKTFTKSNEDKSSNNVNMDEVMADLKESLPE